MYEVTLRASLQTLDEAYRPIQAKSVCAPWQTDCGNNDAVEKGQSSPISDGYWTNPEEPERCQQDNSFSK